MEKEQKLKLITVVSEPETIDVLADLERSNILRLLAENSLTETRLSEILEMKKASIGYHLHILLRSGLIHLEKTEAERHGIIQKYYRSNAIVYLPDFRKASSNARRYFVDLQRERLRGMVAALGHTHGNNKPITSSILERMSYEALDELTAIAYGYEPESIRDREALLQGIYLETLRGLLDREDWKRLFSH